MSRDTVHVEIWKQIPGLNGKYEASSLGRVRSVAGGKFKGVVLKTYLRNGYLSVRIGKKPGHCYVHRLVCATFQGPPPSESHIVLHYDGDKQNPLPANLRWGTKSENAYDAQRHGTMPALKPYVGPGRVKGERAGSAKLTVPAVVDLRRRYALGETLSGLSREFSLARSSLRRAIQGVSWAHVGG